MGTSSLRNSSSGACSETASATLLRSASLYICGTSPEVESVTRRRERSKPKSSRKISSAGTTLRKLASGSPMPMRTTLLTMRSRAESWAKEPASSRLASQTCPTISAVVRLRLKPCCAVEQNEQSSAQPTCEEMQRVPRSGSGMKTISNACEASARNTHLRVPSADCCAVTICGVSMHARSLSRARKSLARSVIASNEDSPRLYTQFMSWRARKGLLPSSATNASSAGRGSPSRFVAVVSEEVMTASAASAARMQLRRAEEIGDLTGGRIRRIGAMDDVLLDTERKVGADGALSGFLRVGGAHDLAVAGDGVIALEHLHYDRTGGHVAHQILEEGTLPVDGVEAFGLPLGQTHHAGGNDGETGLLETTIDLADEIAADAVGLDYRQGALERHSGSFQGSGSELALQFTLWATRAAIR